MIAQVATHRLVTVRGMPGIGKTEVAREAAALLADDPRLELESVLWVALDKLESVNALRARIADWANLASPDVTDTRLTRAIGARRALLAGALFDALQPEERTAAGLTELEDWLRGNHGGSEGTLASHSGGRRRLLRAALRLLGHNGTFFDQTQLSSADEAIVKEHLPPGESRRVVIAGHTHAARHVRLDAHRTYVNTGTWTELIPWPPLGTDAEARTFIDDLEQGRVTLQRRLTWALVDEDGAQLREEPAITA